MKNNTLEIKATEFKEPTTFNFRGHIVKIAHYKEDYYISLQHIIELGEYFNTNLNYVTIFDELNEEDKISGYTVIDEDSKVPTNLVKIDVLYKFKTIETNEEMVKFLTQTALYVNTHLKSNMRIKISAGLASGMINKGQKEVKGVTFDYVQYDGKTYFKSNDINEFIKRYTNASSSFSISGFANNVSPLNTRKFLDLVNNNCRYFTLNGIDQALRHFTIRNNSFNEMLMELNSLVKKSEKVDFTLSNVMPKVVGDLKVISKFPFCDLNILIYHLGGKVCFDVESIVRVNMYIGVSDSAVNQFIKLSSKHKTIYNKNNKSKNLVYLSGMLEFFKLRKNNSEVYEGFFIKFARYILENIKGLKYPTLKEIEYLANMESMWDRELKEKERADRIGQRKQEMLANTEKLKTTKHKGEDNMLVIHENGKTEKVEVNNMVENKKEDNIANENEWISSRDLAKKVNGEASYNTKHSNIKRKISLLLNSGQSSNKYFKDNQYKFGTKENHKKTNIAHEYLISREGLELLLNNSNKYSSLHNVIKEFLSSTKITNKEHKETKQELITTRTGVETSESKSTELSLVVNGTQVYVDSREVAEMVGKQHKHLIRDIENYRGVILQSPTLVSEDYFVESTYLGSNNRQTKHYLLTKKGCDMVANKMIGEKGILFTAMYVDAFHKMDEQIKNMQNNKTVDVFRVEEILSNNELLSQLFIKAGEKLKEDNVLLLESQEMKKELENKEQELNNTKAEVVSLQKELEKIKEKFSPVGTYNVNDIAASYSLKGSDINNILHKLGIIIKSGNTWLLSKKYMDKGLEKIEYQKNKYGAVTAHMKWTEKGKDFIEKELSEVGHFPSSQVVKLG